MGTFMAAVVTLGVAVIGASIVYQVVTHPTGTTPITSAATNIVNTTSNNLFK
jgi:hypothetical protein